MKFTFSILTFLIFFSSVCQEVEEEPVEQKTGLKFYDVKLGVNVIRSARTFLGAGISTHEAEGALAFGKFDLVLDFGTEKNTIGGPFSYESKGTYYRAGIDRNFVKNRTKGNVLSLGLRYARANFQDQLSYTLDNGFGDQEIDLSNPNLTSRWLELVFNLRGKITSELYTGFTLRWQFARMLNGEGDLKSFEIPGFGNTKRQNSTAFDYYLMWRIPFGESVRKKS